MLREHPLYLAVCILIAAALQFLLLRRWRRTVRTSLADPPRSGKDQ